MFVRLLTYLRELYPEKDLSIEIKIAVGKDCDGVEFSFWLFDGDEAPEVFPYYHEMANYITRKYLAVRPKPIEEMFRQIVGEDEC